MSHLRRTRKRNKIPVRGYPVEAIVHTQKIDRFDWILPVTACTIGALIFLRTLRFGFIYDDHTQIVGNQQILSWRYFFRLISTDVWSQKGTEHVGYYYRPIFSLWLVLVHMVGGLVPWLWHLSSIFLHVLVIWVVFKLSFTLLGDKVAAFWATVFFAIHPIHIESVCWVSASEEILYSLFCLVAILFLVQDGKDGLRISYLYILSIIFWAAGLFAKERAVSLLPLLFFLTLILCSPPTAASKPKGVILKAGAYFGVALSYVALRWFVLGRSGLEEGRHGWNEVFLTAPTVTMFYLGKLLWPFRLSGLYMNPLLSQPSHLMWLSLTISLIAISVLSYAVFKRPVLTGVAGGLLFLPLLPVLLGIRIFRDGDMAHDRYLYLPSVGVCILVGLLVNELWARLKGARAILVPVLLALSILFAWLNVTQQRFYHDDEAFYKRALEIGPTNTLAMDFLGDYYLKQNKSDLALEQFRRAFALAPDDPEVIYHLSRGLFEMGDYENAEPYLIRVCSDSRISSFRRALVSISLAQTQIKLGKITSAESILKDLEIRFDSLRGVHSTLGTVYEMQGRLLEAKGEYLREFNVSGDNNSKRRGEALTQMLRFKRGSVINSQ
jgi:protein O-mannosyl-transferase